MKLFDKFISLLSQDRVESVLLFLLSTAIMLVLQIYHMKQWTHGLKGDNNQWEGPEILLYICFWVFPPMLFSSGFLHTEYPDLAWYTLMAFMLYGLTGRWGLQWLLAWKSGSNQVITTKTETDKEKITVRKEETKES